MIDFGVRKTMYSNTLFMNRIFGKRIKIKIVRT